ncbi:MAG: SCP2 sterol-binding domain-containing protein [Firmicutes bacterium]|nr:SCP2 sterol-binding domain-containing protein [Bacillota bacterium]
MDFFKAFDKVKTTFGKIDVPVNDGHFAVQVNLTDDDCNGIFYIEMKDNQLFVEPYDYFDNNAVITTALKDFTSILTGKLKAADAAASGKITISGDADRLIDFLNSIKQKKTRSAAKKTAAKAVKEAEKKVEKTAEKIADKAAEISVSAKTVKKAVKKSAKPAAKKLEKKVEKAAEKIADKAETAVKTAAEKLAVAQKMADAKKAEPEKKSNTKKSTKDK